MNIRPSRTAALLILSIAGAFLSIANADEPEPVLSQTGTIRELTTTENSPCKGGSSGGGASEYGHWGLDPNETKIQISQRRNQKHYLDVKWNWFHELQRPHLHVINAGEPPIPDDICQPTPYEIKNYIFLFAIHVLKNPHSEEEREGRSKSPHALVYVPMHTVEGGYEKIGDQFRLFIFDVKEVDTECLKQTAGYPRDRCYALHWLYVKNNEYLAKKITEAKLIEEIQLKIGTIIPTSAAIVPPTPKTAGPPVVLELHLHNGIIHGTLGGG